MVFQDFRTTALAALRLLAVLMDCLRRRVLPAQRCGSPVFARLTRLRAIATASMVAGAALAAAPARAGIFDDNQARQAIIDLRAKVDSLTDQLTAAQRTILDQQNRMDLLQQQIATVRGQNEEMANQLSQLVQQQKSYYADLDGRLKKFEPRQQMVDGVQGLVQPGESNAFNAALQQFQRSDFKGATNAFRDFIKQYPQSPYQPTAQYWLGNALYAQRDYKASTVVLTNLIKNYPTHPRAADALLAVANNQIEQGQKTAAKKTLQRLVAQYANTEAAKTAQTKLSELR